MASEQLRSNLIALNLTRARVTVLVFNLAIISLMLSVMKTGGTSPDQLVLAHLSSFLALFFGFWLTLLGLWCCWYRNSSIARA